MPGLLKAIAMLAFQLHLFTGARIGAFIPAHEDKAERGLRYKVKTLRSYDCAGLISNQAHRFGFVSILYDTFEVRMESQPIVAQRESKPRLQCKLPTNTTLDRLT